MRAAFLLSHVLAAVVVTWLSAAGDAYRLPSEYRRLHHSHHRQQQQAAALDEDAAEALDVTLSSDRVMLDGRRGSVHVNCTTHISTTSSSQVTSNQLPYISFFWQVLSDTGLPLSSSIPGVSIEPILMSSKQHAGHRSRSYRRRHAANGAGVYGAKLVLNWRFYDFLPYGDSKFGCLVYTLAGRRTAEYFIVHKV